MIATQTALFEINIPKLKPTQVFEESRLFFYEEYQKLDKQYYVNINNSYQYLVNFSQIKHLPIHRWFYYQEGYSSDLIIKILKYLDLSDKNPIILDPFAGSGTTLLTAKQLGLQAIGFEINPFSVFMIEGKIQEYSDEELEIVANFELPRYETVENLYENSEFSMIEKLFEKTQLEKISLLKKQINQQKNTKVKHILWVALLCIIQDASFYKKAGNGIKKKKVYQQKDVFELYEHKIKQITEDLKLFSNQIVNVISDKNNTKIILDSCLNMQKYEIENFDLAIFSPPYANCFDYYEVYKMELWIGEFVDSYESLRKLRKEALTSNLNANLHQKITPKYPCELLEKIVAELRNSAQLWDKKIPTMLELYFAEMGILLESLYNKTNKNGYCVIVVGNSAYAGLAVPTDLILANIAEKIGFEVQEIIIARKNETSSQQYKIIGKFIEYIRESIVILKKTVKFPLIPEEEIKKT
jgi:DNA modification methylase